MSLVAVVPVKDLRESKSRLGAALDSRERAEITLRSMSRVIRALREAGVRSVCVVSPDEEVLEAARAENAEALAQRSRGLNPALKEARSWAASRGASSLLVLPADLPLLEARDVREIVEAGAEARVVLAPDRGRGGTNALLLRPPNSLPFAFGPDSFERHLRLARERGLSVRVCERPGVAFDLDTPGDLALLCEPGASRR